MISYKDITFCPFHEDCAQASRCSRPLTEQVQKAADQWWGKPGAPISVFANKPGCHRASEQ